MTCPPAWLMRARSIGFSGLWSSDKSMTFPFLTSIARESPMFAHSTSRLLKSTATTQAVLPIVLKGCTGTGRTLPKPNEPLRSLKSSFGKASSKLRIKQGVPVSPLPFEALPSRFACPRPQSTISLARIWAASADTSLPPWPSNTAKSATSGKTEASNISLMCESSMASRHPRMPPATHVTAPAKKVPDSIVTFMSGVTPTTKPETSDLSTDCPTKVKAP
mmetsp:Transcript_107508/g.272811  ORF Transcript_107508/g.272811 Transcript_107508/m.272811 type:complete len:220 (-) Transcript_107508:190-849(-)